MTNETTASERERFETFARQVPANLERLESGPYVSSVVSFAWRAWQARAAQPLPKERAMSDKLLKAARQVLAALDSEYPREDVPIGHVRTLAEAALASAPQASQPPQGAADNFEQELRSGGRWSPEMIERVAGAEPAIFNAISAYTPPGTHSATASPLPAPQEPAEPLGEVVGLHKVGFAEMTTVAWTKKPPPIGTKLYAAPATDSTRGTP